MRLAPARWTARTCLAGLLAAAAGLAGAQTSPQTVPQSVSLAGVMGSKALLVIDGGAPRAVGAGESFAGVKVVSTDGNNAVLEIGGRRQSLRVGGQPVSVGQQALPGAGTRIVLSASLDGHFVTQGLINARPAQFLVDTGATTLGVGLADAERMGLDYKNAPRVHVGTANGVVQGWRIRVASVRLNDVEVRDVEAVVTPYPMPYVLLGNSFLTRFQMTRTNEQMVLERRF